MFSPKCEVITPVPCRFTSLTTADVKFPTIPLLYTSLLHKSLVNNLWILSHGNFRKLRSILTVAQINAEMLNTRRSNTTVSKSIAQSDRCYENSYWIFLCYAFCRVLIKLWHSACIILLRSNWIISIMKKIENESYYQWYYSISRPIQCKIM